ncbi:caffeic acid 3-O-methyltransferase-like [Macadamia integrifolia]|uniref:caffeic acid 3-O-methyltransferase-like n=1 Tax=Macadamia integrifolia TaxID=60698 RepID=UPI001C50037A|nr:caffeic acid 3-O-methyltransferase-like [Macadamia integrifolia]
MASLENQPNPAIPSCANSEADLNPNIAFVSAMEMASSLILPMVLRAALELDLLEIIARAGPDAQLSASMVTSQLPTQNPDAPMMVDRILRFLASHSMLTCSHVTHENGRVERLYGLAPLSFFFVGNQGPDITGFIKLLTHKAYFESWYQLKDAVLEGGTPFDKAHGMSMFEYAATDPGFSEIFTKSVAKANLSIMEQILVKYNGFENAKVVVDVGGGIGAMLNLITSKYPTIKGINFDLPHVIQNAPSYTGAENVGGDMFVSVPRGDVILLKAVLHNWNDDQCLKLLMTCYKALPDHGKVVVIDGVLPEVPEPNNEAKLAFRTDILMMVQHIGGKERTVKEFEELAKGAGFIGTKVVCCVLNHCVIEFYK